MPDITINQLLPIGSELFRDDESFLEELSDGEATHIRGGLDAEIISLPQEVVIISFPNPGINGQSVNAVSVGNANTIAA